MKFHRLATGPHVKDLQSKLIALGYNLPRYGADTTLGEETVSALERWWMDAGVDAAEDGIQDSEIQRACDEFLVCYADYMGRTPAPSRRIQLVGEVVDRKGLRPWKQVDSIVLHMTACGLSVTQWTTVPIHIGVPRSSGYLGKFFQLHPLIAYLYHANALNARSVGIEIEGNFCGIEGDRRSWWPTGGGPHRLDPTQAEAARAAIKYIVDEARAAGYGIKNILAHRQSSGERRSDPGEAIWKEIALWAKSTYGLSDGGTAFTVGRGFQLPDVWTGEQRGHHY